MSPSKSRNASARPKPYTAPPGSLPEVVDPVWLIKALSITIVAAILCAYLALCFLYYQGAWQLVLHPSRTVDRTPAQEGLAFSSVRFGDFDTGEPHLTAWWLPAQDPSSPSLESRYAALTVLYLHSGSGSLADTLPQLKLLHTAGVNIFAIDYRGYGLSDPSHHPDDARMRQDADAALSYLISVRHIPASAILPCGSGIGASLAVDLVQAHPELPAVILDNPDPDPAATAATVHRSKLVPIRLLFGSRFAIAAPLSSLSTPKLLISGGPSAQSAAAAQASIGSLFHSAASPSYAVALPPAGADAAFANALHRFVDEYLPHR
ncbi:MAG TPA: alpha/beta hydrolase [Acidobacteriaceae bacterium]|nr:alpha/beta hydrolase [Acidobacteriaceae bacterium]